MVQYNPIDSRLLIKILVEITGKKPEAICKEFGLLDNAITRFREGNPKGCFWPNHEVWFASNWGTIKETDSLDSWGQEFFPDEQKFPLEGLQLIQAVHALEAIAKEEKIPLAKLSNQITLASKIYNFFIRALDTYFGSDENGQKRAISLILEVMGEQNIHYSDIDTVNKRKSYEEVVEFLIRRAVEAKGSPLVVIKKAVNTNTADIVFRQLSHDDILTPAQLKEISTLIWESDDYVFPAVFDRSEMMEIMPIMLASNRDMQFSLDNIFAAFENDNIIGIILHKKGPLNWSSEYLSNLAGNMDVPLSEHLKKTETEYFSKYNSTPKETTAMLNFAIEATRKIDDINNGGPLMGALLNGFLNMHKEALELYVLKETDVEMMTYIRAGFEIVKKVQGYSYDNRNLPCYFLRREA